jgi:hypothetical protein
MPARLSIAGSRAMSRMINALFSRSPQSAYEILSTRFNGIGLGSRLGPSLPVSSVRALARPASWVVA